MLGRFDYERPTHLAEAVRLFAETPSAAILAGGTDLLVELRGGRHAPRLLVDVKRVDGLRRLDAGPRGDLTIGAAVSLNELLEHAAIRRSFPGLAQAAASIATYQLRNRATVTGNLCNASPAADLAPALLVLGAAVGVAGPQGERVIPLPEFFAGVKRTTLARGEIATEVRIPAPEPGLRSAFLKQQRLRGHDLAVANVAGALVPSTGALRLAFGSCAPTPILLVPIETKGMSADAVGEAAAASALAAARPISDVRASAEYRRAVLPVLVRRVVAELLGGGAT